MANTGYKAWALLEQYTVETGIVTGNEKPNVSSDPDYIPPALNLSDCPLPEAMEPYTATTTAAPACSVGYESPFSSVTGSASGMVPVASGPTRTAAIALLSAAALANAQSNANATCVLATPHIVTAHLSGNIAGSVLTLTVDRDSLYNGINNQLDVNFTVRNVMTSTNVYTDTISLVSGLGPFTNTYGIGVGTSSVLYAIIINTITTGYSASNINMTST